MLLDTLLAPPVGTSVIKRSEGERAKKKRRKEEERPPRRIPPHAMRFFVVVLVPFAAADPSTAAKA